MVLLSSDLCMQYASSFASITTTNALGVLVSLVGAIISNNSYVYEALISLVDIGEDCTLGTVNTNIADFRSDFGQGSPEAYWVNVQNRVDNIR